MRPSRGPRLAAAGFTALLTVAPALAQPAREPPSEVRPLEVRPLTPSPEEAIARGQAMAATRCAGCHSVNPEGPSPYRAAPPFRELGPIPPYALQARLRVLLGKPHYGMPQQFLTLSEAKDLAAFIESAKRPAPGDRRLRAYPCVATAC